MKRLILIAAGLLIGLAVSAQTSLNGTWIHEDAKDVTETPEGGEGGKMRMQYDAVVTFRFNGAGYSMRMTLSMDMDLSGNDKKGKPVNAVFSVKATGDVDGTMVRKGDRLTLTPDKGTKPRIEVEVDAKDVPGGGLMKSMLTGPMKKELASDLKKVQEYRIVSLTASELTLEEVLSDKDLKKGEEPETMVFRRKP